MRNNNGRPESHEPEVTYFYEFIRLLEEQYAWASVELISEELDYAREFGPAIAGLKRRKDGVFEMIVPIGRGDFAMIELEYDRNGVLQPVMGGFLRKK